MLSYTNVPPNLVYSVSSPPNIPMLRSTPISTLKTMFSRISAFLDKNNSPPNLILRLIIALGLLKG